MTAMLQAQSVQRSFWKSTATEPLFSGKRAGAPAIPPRQAASSPGWSGRKQGQKLSPRRKQHVNKPPMKHTPKQNEITTAVRQFMQGKRACYVTPGTSRHSANFYGDTHICKLSRRDVINTIECVIGEWETDNDGELRPMTVAECIEAILSDLQLDRPEE